VSRTGGEKNWRSKADSMAGSAARAIADATLVIAMPQAIALPSLKVLLMPTSIEPPATTVRGFPARRRTQG
jgi:hypothetical protein